MNEKNLPDDIASKSLNELTDLADEIIINLEILMTNETEPKGDNLKETQDYSQFRKAAKDIVDSQHFQLLEVLTNKIHLIINENKFVVGSRVTICKPDIFNDCEVAYEISNI